jgi:hypothetical protein
MAKPVDLVGLKFGEWSVLNFAGSGASGRKWLCRCSCGTERVVIGDSLKKGLSKSCGCKARDWCRTHGMEGTSVYVIWAGMIQRCNNPDARGFARYGARGISVCPQWLSFEGFYADMGDRPEGMTLDRIDNDGNYEPGNCRWATAKRQARNRRKTKLLEFRGEKRPMSEWAEIMGIKRKVLENRIRAGWSVEDALTKPKSGRWGVLT